MDDSMRPVWTFLGMLLVAVAPSVIAAVQAERSERHQREESERQRIHDSEEREKDRENARRLAEKESE